MTVYIEYALAENFAIDFALLIASGYLLRVRPNLFLIGISALVGAGFAVLFPLLRLTAFAEYALKTAVGALMCLIANERVKTKKEWGRYALNTLCFFLLTFAFAGLLSYTPAWVSPPLVGLSLAGVTVLSAVFCRAVYKRRALHRFLYDCTLYYGEKQVQALGYFDSGNLARNACVNRNADETAGFTDHLTHLDQISRLYQGSARSAKVHRHGDDHLCRGCQLLDGLFIGRGFHVMGMNAAKESLCHCLHLIFTPDSRHSAAVSYQDTAVKWGYYHILRLILHPNPKNVQTVNAVFCKISP